MRFRLQNQPQHMNMNFMYNSTSPLQQAPSSQMPNQTPQSAQQFVQGISRSFSQDGPTGPTGNVASGSFGRFPNMGPRTHPFRGGAPHVSSSTHPQNMGKSFHCRQSHMSREQYGRVNEADCFLTSLQFEWAATRMHVLPMC